jgi:tRNA G18 (ribose-2'-O)-methylase SpoU
MNMSDDPRNLVDAYKGMSVESIAQDMRTTAFPVHIAIENLQHDFNIGSIVRSANAFNVSSVHIIGRRHWNKRGAMSTEKYLDVIHHDSVEHFLARVTDHKLRVIGVDNIEGSVPLQSAGLPVDCILVFGQEGPGLSSELRTVCEYLVAIEQFGSTRSVNVGVAAGIVMYEWVRRNHSKPNYPKKC